VQLTAVQQELAAHDDAAAADDDGSFGHQHLARKGVPAVSLSYMAAAPAAQPRVSSLADTAAAVNLDRVLDAAQVRPLEMRCTNLSSRQQNCRRLCGGMRSSI
jgi:hypothetical protein